MFSFSARQMKNWWVRKNCRVWLSVAPRGAGGEVQRKGKEVKRRGGENHVWSALCTALSFLCRLVFVSLYNLVCRQLARDSQRRSCSLPLFICVSFTETHKYSSKAAGGFLSQKHTDCRPWWARQMTSRRQCLTAIRQIPRMEPRMVKEQERHL